MNSKDLDRLYSSGVFSYLDIHFASFLAKLDGSNAWELLLAAALASSHTRQGHICVDLSRAEQGLLPEGKDGQEPLLCPPLDRWVELLEKSPVVGKPGEYRPLVLDERARLYLYRYWDYQEKLSAFIKSCIGRDEQPMDLPLLKQALECLFLPQGDEIDWQKVGAFTALNKQFCVLSGGPGTGKTTTVAKLLALLAEHTHPAELRIALAAPTGKAAARLQEAIGRVKETLNCPENIKQAVPEEASTVHRLLGSIPDSPYFRHNRNNPLRLDVVVVDEASMMDLALMSKLVQALGPEARLILVGDKDQLASVEAGAVLGDICDTGKVHGFSRRFCDLLRQVTGYKIQAAPLTEPESGLEDCIVHLQKSYRFGPESGIGAVSRAVNRGESTQAAAMVRDGTWRDISWRNVPRPDDLAAAMRQSILEGFEWYLDSSYPPEVFQRFACFRILCALREGPYGVIALNSLIEDVLARHGLIQPDRRWYRGRPVMITRNDYQMRLFNGDVGIVLPDPDAGGDLRAFFPGAEGALRAFRPLRLPEHETVYAMTVHKSQGSEFDRVLLLLPDRESPLLTRELIYTGITRARRSVEIWGREVVFQTAVSRRIQRSSGLRDALWKVC
ncbi:MAG: exodeoxyribonuclease V subunit alpha [Syntrophobacteria bacterium]